MQRRRKNRTGPSDGHLKKKNECGDLRHNGLLATTKAVLHEIWSYLNDYDVVTCCRVSKTVQDFCWVSIRTRFPVTIQRLIPDGAFQRLPVQIFHTIKPGAVGYIGEKAPLIDPSDVCSSVVVGLEINTFDRFTDSTYNQNILQKLKTKNGIKNDNNDDQSKNVDWVELGKRVRRMDHQPPRLVLVLLLRRVRDSLYCGDGLTTGLGTHVLYQETRGTEILSTWASCGPIPTLIHGKVVYSDATTHLDPEHDSECFSMVKEILDGERLSQGTAPDTCGCCDTPPYDSISHPCAPFQALLYSTDVHLELASL